MIGGVLGLVVAVMVIAKLFAPLVGSVSIANPTFVDAAGVENPGAVADVAGVLPALGTAYCAGTPVPLATASYYTTTYSKFKVGDNYCLNQEDGTVGSLMLIIPLVLAAITLMAIVSYMRTRSR